MDTTPTPTPRPARRPANRTYRIVRQLHLWVGAWGSIAAILFGLTGLILNHRMGDSPWPQGDSHPTGEQILELPVSVRDSVESLSLWLRQTQGLDAHTLRKPRPAGAGGPPAASGKWTLVGGSARNAWSGEFEPGQASVTIQHTRHSTLAVFNRLHKGIGGSRFWTVLSDSYAIGMLLLGISGIWMWARGRGGRDLLLSVMTLGLAALASALVLAFA